MTIPVNFHTISNDPDSYKLAFSTDDRPERGYLFHVLYQAMQLRLNEELSGSSLKASSMSNKTDLFEPFEADRGYIEIDTLYSSESVIALDAYLYTPDGHLKGKASCTIRLSASTSSISAA